MMRLIFLLLVLGSYCPAFAQDAAANAAYNRTDARGRRTGMWLTQQPERMGEPAYAEFGNYVDGRKTGAWYRMNGMGEIQAIERYKSNVLDGEVKYFEQGRLVCVGHYLGLNPDHDYDTVFIMDPITQVEKLTRIPTDRGTLRHGTWRFYDAEKGRLIREEEWSVDELISRKDFPISAFDSAYYERRMKQMPHNQKRIYQSPAGKRSLTR